MTVEEAIRKDSEIKAGIDENDNILDRYIKQHRDEVGKHKFENKVKASQEAPEEIDDFIQEKREEVNPSQENLDFDHIKPEELPENQDLSDNIILGETKKFSNSKSLIIGGLIALLLAIFAFGYILNHLNSSSTIDKETTVTKEKDTKANDEDIKAFNDMYASYFVDKELTKLKNSEFERLSELEVALNKLKGTSTYTSAKEKYDSLKKAIDAIKVVNEQFTDPVIVDGEKVSGTIKESANFDTLSTTMLNTGKANLDNLLQNAVSEGRKQLTDKAEKEKIASANQAATEASVSQPSNGTENSAPPAINNATVTNNAASLFGISNYDPASLQRDLSRVPYNNDMIADVNNPSWLFNDGILERIVAVAQERGLISGNNYILERVNIINGNGYYNMFKPDGTYLFSINAKTGYFVGNAPGRADDLDY
ncbi:cell division site-positioning protein MapZ family protein [Streptococcus marimammalium]|uniref:cell division site-positioning protein MapZ family protein n=1 Tax=Streptococcus marimammalium TaxID=269666 RepID=UPI001461644B|nr:cell division site-positioning protein MapZ family protein [Streptococcus marimammalium]